MKKIGIIFLLSIIFSFTSINNNGNYVENYKISKISAFSVGEKLTYRVHYGWLNAGVAEVEVLPNLEYVNGKETFHVKGTGRTVSAFEWFYKVRDEYESNIEVQSMNPLKFKRRVNEGGFKINRDYDFNIEEKKVFSYEREKVYDILDNTQDMLSSFYYLRSIDFSKAKNGDIFNVNTFMDHKNFSFKVQLVSEETIEVDAGKFKCYKFSPVVEEGRVFKSKDDLQVWVTKDHNKIPILVEAKIIVGSVKMELNKYENITNPLSLTD